MTTLPVNVFDVASRFFDKYLICLAKAGVPEKRRRWYVKHIEAFIKAQNGHKIKTLSADDVNQYFDMLGRQNRLQGWQFSQRIDAIRIMYCELFALPVCQKVDWDYLLESARLLENDHPTNARKLTPEELAFLKERRGEGPLQQVRADHHDLLVHLASEIRRRGYAYRTEQNYAQWTCRYILFCMGLSSDKAFLRYPKHRYSGDGAEERPEVQTDC